ncbi:MAG: TonB-dependent receptor [Verrucomicrobia bacterium]|nr:TonB-dependent receptor [Verrucomicrobiota bacterium]
MKNPVLSPGRPSVGFWLALFALMLGLFPVAAHAQNTGTISGRVLNQGTGEYLRNAVVTVPGTNLSATAEAGGVYTLTGVPAGSTRVVVTYAGLDAKEQTVNVTAGQTVPLDVTLTSAAYGDQGVVKLEQFVVATEREGNAKAIMEQRNSIEAKRVLATDTFGSISEGNVGEFMKYLPGVMIDYTEADARSISLGGLDTKYTAVTIDGAPVASSGLAAASGTGATRGFEFEQISIGSIETVELSRTPQPENPGSALAGIVNLRSKGAFDISGSRTILNAGVAYNSMSGNPFKKHPGWDDEDHYRVQPNFGVEYSNVFLNKRLGVRAGYNYSYTFAEQKALTIAYAFDTNLTNNATEIPRLSQIAYRDSPKPTIRYNANLRLDYKISPELWVSARGEYNRYQAKFFSRDLTYNFTTTANAPGSTATPAGVEYSLSSQTATVGTVQVNQGGGGTNKYGATSNFGLGAYFKRGNFRADVTANMSRSQTWYKDRQFGFFWSINPSALGGLGLRFNRNGPADPVISITQTSGPDYRNLANYPNGFTATTNDRQGEDQRWLGKADMQYTMPRQIPIIFKFGVHINQWVNNVDRPISNRTYTRVGQDGVAASADENLARWAEPSYRMNFLYGGNIDGMANLDRWALYKDFQANPSYWTAPTAAQLLQDSLQNARDVKEQVDAIYDQTVFKIGQLTLAPGFRVEHTRGSALGPTDRGDRDTRRVLGLPATGTIDTSSLTYIYTRYGSGRAAANPDYTTWLRYFHSTYRFTDKLVLKGSWNQSIARPDMNRLIGGLVVTNDDPNDPAPNRANAGNAGLKPELSETINLTLEYYLRGIGQFTVSGFRRDFKDLLRTRVVTVPAGGTWNGEPLPTSVSPNEAWEINTVDNIGKSHMSSLEFALTRNLDFLPDPFKKIRVTTNYTTMKYDNYENYFRAQNVANLSWYIPYRRFSLSWNTNWRPGYRVEAQTSSNGWPKYVAESLTHTMDFGWNFRRNTSFYITARNITNGAQSGDEYRDRSDLRTRWVRTGAIWTTGVRATF